MSVENALDPALAGAGEGEETLWYDIRHLGPEGKGWTDTKAPYDRLPARAEGRVREPVWNLGHHSAGMCVRFKTDAPTIQGRWTLTSANLAMNHMAATGVSGLDLYAKKDAGWGWLGVGRPAAQTNAVQLAGNLPDGPREYLLYLPLYNTAGVRNLHYLHGDHLLREDGEGTVDGSHPTDLGFSQMADAFEVALRPILGQ